MASARFLRRSSQAADKLKSPRALAVNASPPGTFGIEPLTSRVMPWVLPASAPRMTSAIEPVMTSCTKPFTTGRQTLEITSATIMRSMKSGIGAPAAALSLGPGPGTGTQLPAGAFPTGVLYMVGAVELTDCLGSGRFRTRWPFLAVRHSQSGAPEPEEETLGDAVGVRPKEKTINKILVANRGEIACRVMRTAKRMGIATVAVYSDVDRHALYVEQADEAIRIGPALAKESYLNTEAVLSAVQQTGAHAVHPGYGFLSENAEFADLCTDAGVEFIGPPASAIRAMGDKSAAKEVMTSAGVPVVPGYHGEDQSFERLEHEAVSIGFPLLIKATQGGGGKGMRIVTGREGFKEGLEGAVREAQASFGNGRVLLERYIQRPRHVEVQVFADKLGGVVHLFERDCSVQRRHQKILEEAPAPGLDNGVREQLGRAAVEAARAVGYESAGTVEFIFDCDSKEFFFMEMNTRLQVEHPVTEMIVGLDLVEWQINVAMGKPLPLLQNQIQCHGHAFEARLYAENVPRGFLPSSGPLLHYTIPDVSRGSRTVRGSGASAEESQHVWPTVRVESGVREGDVISTFYDPLIAKLVVWGEDRNRALKKLHASLATYHVAGLPTNLPLLRALAAHPGFVNLDLDTHFIKRYQKDLLPLTEEDDVDVELNSKGQGEGARAALRIMLTSAASAAGAAKCLVDRWQEQAGRKSVDPWHDGSGFRVNHTHKRTIVLTQGEEGDALVHGEPFVVPMDIEYCRDGSFAVHVGSHSDDHRGTRKRENRSMKPIEVSGTVNSLRTVQSGGGEFKTTAINAEIDLTVQCRTSQMSFCEYFRDDKVHFHVWLKGYGPGCGHFHFTVPVPFFSPPDLDHPDNEAFSGLLGQSGLHGPGAVQAPMAGRVVRLCAEEGCMVRRGDPILILESMKMEHTVRAPCSGRLVSVKAKPGQQISDGLLLAVVEGDT